MNGLRPLAIALAVGLVAFFAAAFLVPASINVCNLSCTIFGTVTDATSGLPMQGLQILVTENGVVMAVVQVDANGNYLAIVPDWNVQYMVLASATGYYPFSKTVTMTVTGNIVLSWQMYRTTSGPPPPGSGGSYFVTVTVLNALWGSPIRNATVTVGDASGYSVGVSPQTTGANGVAGWSLAVGTYRITASAQGYVTNSTTVVVTNSNVQVSLKLQISGFKIGPAQVVIGLVAGGGTYFLARRRKSRGGA